MIKSMTGFGRSEYNDGKRNIIAEIRSVNHRYSDITVKMPRRYAFAEDHLKGIVKKMVKRGKADLFILVESMTEEDANIKLNTALARQYYGNLIDLKEEFELEGEITLGFLASLPDVMKTIPNVEDEEAITNSLSEAVGEAVKALNDMRIDEGAKLAEDIIKRADIIEGLIDSIEELAPASTLNYMDKLKERIEELVEGSVEIPQDRILLEAAIYADKSNITEEIVRLNSHIKQLRSIIGESTQPDGKKLDFLVQEMNREANTIGSKANNIEITNKVLDVKSEVEKIREQVQNIE
ncbi:MAG: YicC/YloC family endoribonuclease [Anaerovoracaceae bacterium]|jgi:uncharacterized protein (TIGR00255 family)